MSSTAVLYWIYWSNQFRSLVNSVDVYHTPDMLTKKKSKSVKSVVDEPEQRYFDMHLSYKQTLLIDARTSSFFSPVTN